MKKPSLRRLQQLTILAAVLLAKSAIADVVITSFDYFSDNARYGSWINATVTPTPTNYIVTATGYGSNWRYLGGINATGNTNIQLNVSLSGPPAADGQLGPIIALVDNDGTYVNYAWYGQPLSNNLVLTGNLFSQTGSPGFTNWTASAGSVPGLDLSNIQHMHMAMDPGALGTSGAYTVAWNDLRLTGDGSGTGLTGVCAVVAAFDGQGLGGTLGSWSNPTVTSSNLQVTATGWGGGWAAVSPVVSTTADKQLRLNVSLTAPDTANGKLGPIVILQDSDGTQLRFPFYGQSPGANQVLTSSLGTGTIVQAGTTAGFNFSAIAFVQVQLDPSTYSGAYTVEWNDISIIGCENTSGGTGICTTIDSFNNAFLGVYEGWTYANESATETNWQMTATGFGGGFLHLVPAASTTEDKTLQLKLTLQADAAASGKLGPLVVLEDGDGTQLRYAWYGQSPGTNLVLRSSLSSGLVVLAGSIPGFDFSTISYYHLQLDPGSYTGSYTFIADDLSIIGCAETVLNVSSFTYDRQAQQLTLSWNSEPNATYAVQATSDLSAGFTGDIASGIPSGGATTTITISATDPVATFVRVRKE